VVDLLAFSGDCPGGAQFCNELLPDVSTRLAAGDREWRQPPHAEVQVTGVLGTKEETV